MLRVGGGGCLVTFWHEECPTGGTCSSFTLYPTDWSIFSACPWVCRLFLDPLCVMTFVRPGWAPAPSPDGGIKQHLCKRHWWSFWSKPTNSARVQLKIDQVCGSFTSANSGFFGFCPFCCCFLQGKVSLTPGELDFQHLSPKFDVITLKITVSLPFVRVCLPPHPQGSFRGALSPGPQKASATSPRKRGAENAVVHFFRTIVSNIRSVHRLLTAQRSHHLLCSCFTLLTYLWLTPPQVTPAPPKSRVSPSWLLFNP